MGKAREPVEGTILDDVIDLGFTDADGTMVTDNADDIFAYDGADFVFAGAGNDRVWGGDGADTLQGGGGGDSLYGGQGDDVLWGQAGSDKLYGHNGDDHLIGGGSHDLLVAGGGNDTLRGGGGHDRLYGNKGNNELYGDSGDDFLSTGDHTSSADGGDGDDEFEIRMKKGGDHILTGGQGADEFRFVQAASSGISDLTVTDFELGIDSFSVDGVDGAAYLLDLGADSVVASGGDTLVHLATGDSILFKGILETDFEAHYGL